MTSVSRMESLFKGLITPAGARPTVAPCNSLSFNASKFQLFFPFPPTSFSLSIESVPLLPAASLKYLSVSFLPFLKGDLHIKLQIDKALKASHIVEHVVVQTQ